MFSVYDDLKRSLIDQFVENSPERWQIERIFTWQQEKSIKDEKFLSDIKSIISSSRDKKQQQQQLRQLYWTLFIEMRVVDEKMKWQLRHMLPLLKKYSDQQVVLTHILKCNDLSKLEKLHLKLQQLKNKKKAIPAFSTIPEDASEAIESEGDSLIEQTQQPAAPRSSNTAQQEAQLKKLKHDHKQQLLEQFHQLRQFKKSMALLSRQDQFPAGQIKIVLDQVSRTADPWTQEKIKLMEPHWYGLSAAPDLLNLLGEMKFICGRLSLAENTKNRQARDFESQKHYADFSASNKVNASAQSLAKAEQELRAAKQEVETGRKALTEFSNRLINQAKQVSLSSKEQELPTTDAVPTVRAAKGLESATENNHEPPKAPVSLWAKMAGWFKKTWSKPTLTMQPMVVNSHLPMKLEENDNPAAKVLKTVIEELKKKEEQTVDTAKDGIHTVRVLCEQVSQVGNFSPDVMKPVHDVLENTLVKADPALLTELQPLLSQLVQQPAKSTLFHKQLNSSKDSELRSLLFDM